jgi:hypothetical protein
MRFLRLIPAVVVLFFTGAAYSQEWSEYVNRENFFTVNFPGEPTMTQAPYKTAKGTNLTARIFTANAPATSILAGKYSMTVVDYSSAPAELATAMEEAAAASRARGVAKYDAGGMIDNIKSWRMTVETPANRRIFTEILVHGNRLYIVDGDTPTNVPPPAQFQASVQILDENGVRIRYRSVGSTERVR